jgi:hypothetical protein
MLTCLHLDSLESLSASFGLLGTLGSRCWGGTAQKLFLLSAVVVVCVFDKVVVVACAELRDNGCALTLVESWLLRKRGGLYAWVGRDLHSAFFLMRKSGRLLAPAWTRIVALESSPHEVVHATWPGPWSLRNPSAWHRHWILVLIIWIWRLEASHNLCVYVAAWFQGIVSVLNSQSLSPSWGRMHP